MSNQYTKVGPGIIKWCSSKKAKPGKFGAKYECSIVLEPEHAKAFNAQFEASLQEALQAAKSEYRDEFIASLKVKYPFYEETNEDGVKTGKWIAKATRPEFRNEDIPNAPKVVDTNKHPIEDEVANGSTGSIVVTVRPWSVVKDYKTISMPLWLEVVQVDKLIAYSEKQNPLDVL